MYLIFARKSEADISPAPADARSREEKISDAVNIVVILAISEAGAILAILL